MIQHWFGYDAPAFPGVALDPGAIRHAGLRLRRLGVHSGRLGELADRLPGMMTLISLAITRRVRVQPRRDARLPRRMPLWEELATLVTIMLLGHWIEMRSISQAQGALKELAKLLPDTAVRVVGESHGRGAAHPRCATATSCSFARARACQPTASCEDGRARSTSR